MKTVSLREYNRDIESMIEGGRAGEAIAHCQHILKTFPMHVETYRQLGKACLEARRYADAEDVFQRVLMAVPDDFIAHVGISIIRDDGGKVEEAVWHMERAFEIQPSNPVIHSELKRLYGKRDGVEPTRVRLTRDALANMYSQGELYDQAIGEIRSMMTDDADRADLQVMLARAYFHGGQKVEATELAITLLKKYPYCLDALRILVDILPETARADDAEVYRSRVEQLDPYAEFVKGSIFRSEEVADVNVTLDRLAYTIGSMPEITQLSWASTLGSKFKTSPLPSIKTGETIPTYAPPSPEDRGEQPVTPPATPTEKPETDIPDWLRSAGWQEVTVEEKESTSPPATQAQPSEAVTAANIPDWLLAMAPNASENNEEIPVPDRSITEVKETPTPSAPFMAISSTEEPIEKGGAEELFTGSAETPQVTGETQPTWMGSVSPWKPSPAPFEGEIHPTPEEPVEQPLKMEPLLSQDETETGVIGGTGLALGSLEALAAEEGAKPEELPTRAESLHETVTEGGEQEMPQSLPEVEVTPELDKTPPPIFSEDDEQKLTPHEPFEPELPTGIAPEEETTPPSIFTEEIEAATPQFISEEGIAGSPSEATAEASTLVAPEESLPSPAVSEPIKTSIMGGDTLNWLDSLSAKETQETTSPTDSAPGPAVESLSVKPSLTTPEEEVSEWLRNLEVADKGGTPPEKPTPASTPATGDELPDWLKSVIRPTFAAEPTKDEDLPEWLRTPAEAPGSPFEQEPPIVGKESEGEVEMTLGDEDHPPAASLTPTVPGEWLPAEGTPPITVAPEEILPAGKGEPAVTAPLDFDVETALSSVQPAVKPFASEEDESAPTMVGVEEISSPTLVEPETQQSSIPLIGPEENIYDLDTALPPMQPAARPFASESEEHIPTAEEVEESSMKALFEPEEKQPSIPVVEAEEKPFEIGMEASPTPMQPEAKPFPSESEERISTAEEVEKSFLTARFETKEEQPFTPVIEPVEKPVIKVEAQASTIVEREVHMTPDVIGTVEKQKAITHAPGSEKDADLMLSAQQALKDGNLNGAMAGYARLIKKGRSLDKIINDLREAVYSYPVEANLWQWLGDAYNRANRLQEALDAYTKAEELLM